MQRREIRGTRLGLLALAVVVLCLAIMGVFVVALGYGREHVKSQQRSSLLQGARIGDTREQVIERLGDPAYIVQTSDEFTGTDAYKPVPAMAISKEVLEYYTTFYKLYVYIDDTDHVETVFLAST